MNVAAAAIAGAALPAPEDLAAQEEITRPSSVVARAGIDVVTLTINGINREIALHPFTTLLEALRQNVDLLGTKRGCGTGACGACTVLLDGRRIKSCLTLAAMCEHRVVATIEGLAQGNQLHPLQRAFVEYDAFQCGYCTPGQIMSAAGYLAERHDNSADEGVIRAQMSGNICRCGAYPNIVKAIAAVASRR